jgi:NitT/TauT family transport system permease protein
VAFSRSSKLDDQSQPNRLVSNIKRFAIQLLFPAATIALVIVIWLAVTAIQDPPEYVLPTVGETLRMLVSRWEMLLQNAGSTLTVVLLGFGLSIVAGTVLGLMITSSRLFERFVYPLLVGSQAVPKVALAPLFVVWFGFGVLPRVLITFLIAFFPIVVSTMAGLRAVEPEFLYLSETIGLSKIDTFRKVRLPISLPHIFSGLKVGMTLATVGAVVAEFVGSDSGLGTVTLRAIGLINTPLMFAALIVITAMGVALFALVNLMERLAIPWHVSQRKRT